MTTPPEVVARVVALALFHPAYGCNRLEALLALEGRRLSAITIQKILKDKSLGTRHERWLALEQKNAEQAIELSPSRRRFWRSSIPLGTAIRDIARGKTVERFVSQSSARQEG